jgi:hypothetical protein
MRHMDIETALRWAYRVELPKAAGNGAGMAAGLTGNGESLASLHILGTVVDVSTNCYGAVIDYSAWDEPDADAVRIGNAVMALSAVTAGVPDGWEPFDDVASAAVRALLGEAVARVAADIGRSVSLPALIRRNAVVGCGNGWEADDWRAVPATNAAGGPCWIVMADVPVAAGGVWRTEVDGWDARARRPRPGAYRKMRVVPEPMPVARARAEYELWHAALAMLRDELAGTLQGIALTDSLPPVRPWRTAQPAPRVLPEISCPDIPARNRSARFPS